MKFYKDIILNITPMASVQVRVPKIGKPYFPKEYNSYRRALFVLLRNELSELRDNISKDTPISLNISFKRDKILIRIETLDSNKYNIHKPDLDNLLKPLLDELKCAIGIDDSRFVSISAKKEL